MATDIIGGALPGKNARSVGARRTAGTDSLTLESAIKRPSFVLTEIGTSCAAYHLRGRSVCDNGLTIPMEIADEAALSALEEGLVHPAVLDAAVHRATGRLVGTRDARHITTIRRDLTTIESEPANPTAAVAVGGDVPMLIG